MDDSMKAALGRLRYNVGSYITVKEQQADLDLLTTTLSEQEAELQRYRQALVEIRGIEAGYPDDYCSIARAALSREDPQDG